MESDWDARYREGLYDRDMEVDDLVKTFAPAFPRHKPVVDIAMGRGRDVLFLARAGFGVCGLEKSTEAVHLALETARREGLKITAVLGDALSLPFKAGSAGAVLVFRFLERKILDDIRRLLAPGGVLLYETFLKRQSLLGTGGPTNPAYLLEDGELYERFRSLELLFYEEGVYNIRGRQQFLARFAGRKR